LRDRGAAGTRAACRGGCEARSDRKHVAESPGRLCVSDSGVHDAQRRDLRVRRECSATEALPPHLHCSRNLPYMRWYTAVCFCTPVAASSAHHAASGWAAPLLNCCLKATSACFLKACRATNHAASGPAARSTPAFAGAKHDPPHSSCSRCSLGLNVADCHGRQYQRCTDPWPTSPSRVLWNGRKGEGAPCQSRLRKQMAVNFDFGCYRGWRRYTRRGGTAISTARLR
jgi:hypothetical protein